MIVNCTVVAYIYIYITRNIQHNETPRIYTCISKDGVCCVTPEVPPMPHTLIYPPTLCNLDTESFTK